MSMQSDLEILSEMLGDSTGENIFGDIIEKNKDNSYYSSFGLELKNQFQNKEQYYNFLLSVVGDFQQLDEKQKEMVQNKMEIFPKTIIKEKIVYKEKKIKNFQKPKLNVRDDY